MFRSGAAPILGLTLLIALGSASDAKAFNLLDELLGYGSGDCGCSSAPACGCAAEPDCGYQVAPSCGSAPKCCKLRLFSRSNSGCCESSCGAPVCESSCGAPACEAPACGAPAVCSIDSAPSCGYEAAPSCSSAPRCCKKRCRSHCFSLAGLFSCKKRCCKSSYGCSSAPDCGCAAEASCGFDSAPSCGYEAAPSCGCAPKCRKKHCFSLFSLFSCKKSCRSGSSCGHSSSCGCPAEPACGCGN